MEGKNNDSKIKVLFKIAICGALFLFLKDKNLKKNSKSFEEKSNSTFKKDILKRANSFEYFNAVLDKKKIYKSAVAVVRECYEKEDFSETALFGKLLPTLNRLEDADKRKIFEFIVLLAYDDRKITDKEKETLNQFRHHLGLSEKELNHYLKKQNPKSKKSYNKSILRLILPVGICVVVFLNPFNIDYPDWLTNITFNNSTNTHSNSDVNKKRRDNEKGYYNEEKIITCSHLLEDRFDPAKEFVSGKEFAKCVNDWKIDSRKQDNIESLSENERKVPQENFELFKSFLRSPEKPKNFFNWVLGVLTVDPDQNFLPYLAVFQHGCIAYLESISGGSNPLVDYFKGRNPDMYQQSSEICNKTGSLLSCGGLEEIYSTNYMVLKEKFEKVNFKTNRKIFEGDKDDNEPYKLENIDTIDSKEIDSSSKLWLYRKKELQKMRPESSLYVIKEKEWGSDKKLCVWSHPHFPGNSIGSGIEISKTNECNDYIAGVDFKTTYRSRTDNTVEYDAMSNFIYLQIMDEYSAHRPKPYISKSSNSLHLLAIAVDLKDNNKIFFSHIGKTIMQEGTVNIFIPSTALSFMHMGGYMIYAYDIDNRAFGLLRNLSQPICKDGYVKATSLFFPLIKMAKKFFKGIKDMKSILLKTIISILLISLIFPFWAFAGETLTNIEKNRIESKLRNVFKLQKKSVDNSLILVEKDLDNFLFGPGTSDRLLRYFNKWVRPAESDNDQLWKAFQKEVINKDRFMSFVDDLIEIHFRVYDKLRRDTNREFVVMNLAGIPEIEYSEAKRQLKDAVAKIWQMNEKELRQILYKSAGEVEDINKIKDKELYVMGASIAMEVGALVVGSAVCPICSPVLLGASMAIVVGWFIYQDVIMGEEFEAEMATAQQRFMTNIEKQLETIAKLTKEEFRGSSGLAYRKLVDTITGIITDYYPQIQKENLV